MSNLLTILGLYFSFFRKGFWDATRFRTTIRSIVNNPIVASNVSRCVVIQAVLLGSWFVFEWLLMPLVFGHDNPSMISKFSFMYQIFWLYPLLFLSLYFCGFFATNIEKAHSSLNVDRRMNNTQPQSQPQQPSLSARILPQVWRVLIISQCAAIATILTYIPLIGKFLSFLFISCTNSFYCFDPYWVASGLSIHERINTFQSHYAYFTGFGLPITFASSFLPSAIANMSLFSLAYPMFLIMASSAEPIPLDPSNPYSSSLDFAPPSSTSSSSSSSSKVPSYIPTSLPLLKPAHVIYSFLISGVIPLNYNASSRKLKKSAYPPTSNHPNNNNYNITHSYYSPPMNSTPTFQQQSQLMYPPPHPSSSSFSSPAFAATSTMSNPHLYQQHLPQQQHSSVYHRSTNSNPQQQQQPQHPSKLNGSLKRD